MSQIPQTKKPDAASRLMELVAARKAKAAQESQQVRDAIEALRLQSYNTQTSGDGILLNAKQQEFVDTVLRGESCVLIGAAGTGKTTCTQEAIAALLHSPLISPIPTTFVHRYIKPETPGILITSYTRKAVNNIRKKLSGDIRDNAVTIHKSLEYSPVYYETEDKITGKKYTTMTFEPQRHEGNPLTSAITVVFIEEASMVSVELFERFKAALGSKVIFIFLGDIDQLPPVFGSAILGYKMLELPVIELTEVYRQALESPILKLAHHVRKGNIIKPEELESWNVAGKLKLHPWKKKLDADHAVLTLAAFFRATYDSGNYKPLEDAILIPYNKGCGTLELNKHIANHIAKKQNKVVYEIIGGFNKLYLSVGDRVLYEKEEGTILSISPNAMYHGIPPKEASTSLDYWGTEQGAKPQASQDAGMSLEDIDAFLDSHVSIPEGEAKNQASHVITLKMDDWEDEVTLDTSGEMNALLLSYAITVHKAQGSEWRKVFCCFHQSHNTMMQRELLYTAITRAKEELYVICEPETFVRGVQNQKIKGNTLAEKAEYFKGKVG